MAQSYLISVHPHDKPAEKKHASLKRRISSFWSRISSQSPVWVLDLSFSAALVRAFYGVQHAAWWTRIVGFLMSFTRRSYKIINITAHPAHRTLIFIFASSSNETWTFLLPSPFGISSFFVTRNTENLQSSSKQERKKTNAAISNWWWCCFLNIISPERRCDKAFIYFTSLFFLVSRQTLYNFWRLEMREGKIDFRLRLTDVFG